MKIAFITPEFISEPHNFDGGLANYVYKVAKQLTEEGHDVSVCVSARNTETLDFEGVRVHRVSVRNRLITALDLTTFKKFSVLLRWVYQSFAMNLYLRRNFPTDTVLHYTSYTCPSLLAWLSPQKKKIIRFSGYQPDIYLEYNNRLKDLVYRQIQFLEKIMVNQNIRKFAPSRILIDRLAQFTDKPIDLIRTPFELSDQIRQQVKPNAFAENRKYFLFFGTVGVLKGCLEIAEALPEILRSYPDLHFVCIGKDSLHQGNSFKSIFLNLASSAKDRVHIMDKMPRDELYGYIKNAFRVVLPSRLDNLPNTLLEALGFERIVIATKRSSLDEVIIDGFNGFLCDNSNSSSLLEAFHRSMQLTPTETDKIEGNIKHTMLDFKLKNHTEKLIDFYQQTSSDNALIQ